MLRMGSWLLSRKSDSNLSTRSLDSLAQTQALDSALVAAAQILNDDVDGAEEGLENGHSVFHQLGRGMTAFIRATLGLEQDIMHEAMAKLAEAESTASTEQHRVQHENNAFRSEIYDPGTELALCQAMCQLMSAVIGVLNESLTESLKGFYKLRKAYLTLQSITEAESRYVLGLNSEFVVVDSSTPNNLSNSLQCMPGGFEDSRADVNRESPTSGEGSKPVLATESSEDEDEFCDADENKQTPCQGVVYGTPAQDRFRRFSISESPTPTQTPFQTPIFSSTPRASATTLRLDHDPSSPIFSSPIDVFIHSGANLCFGLLLLMISMIPPAFARLLAIIGFQGDRERGLRLLWQARKFNNFCGAIAGLILLTFYNSISGFCDILPEATGLDASDGEGDLENPEVYPRERCANLLQDLRGRFPNSKLWLLEEARMYAADKDLDTALHLLDGDLESPMKQVEAIAVFEKGLDSMYTHRYQQSADCFLACVRLNDWSHALYYYIAGINHLALYRLHSSTGSSPDKRLALKHAELARKYLQIAPSHTGKRRIFARQMPFDVFVARKIAKWEARAQSRNCEFVDAVGVSPVIEMTFLWSGFKRMSPSYLHACLECLAWDETRPCWSGESADEKAILNLLRAVVWRHLGRTDDARNLLINEVVNIEKREFKGHAKDDWTQPSACYEIGACYWNEAMAVSSKLRNGYAVDRGEEAGQAYDDSLALTKEEQITKCREWVARASSWEPFELNARLGMKFRVAMQTIENVQ